MNGFIGKKFTHENWQARCNRAATDKELVWQSELGKRELVDMHARQQAQLDKLRQGNWKGKEARLVSLQNALHAQHAAEAAAVRERHVREITALKQIQGPGSQRLTPTKDIRDFKGRTFSSKDGKERVTAYREKWSIRNSFVDDGKSVTVLKDNDPKAILAAMQLTLQKYGAIHVQGNEEFKRLCATIAARNGLQIANRELQVITETERRRISEAIQQRTAASGQKRQDPAPARPGAFPGMGPGRETPAPMAGRTPQATPAAPAQAQEQQARHTAESVKATAAEIARGRAMMLSRHELEKLDVMREAQAVGRAQAWPRPITDAHTQQALDRLYETHAREAEAFTNQWGVDPYLHLDQAYVREQEAMQARHDAALVVDVMNLRAMLDRRGVEADGIEEAAKLKENELKERYALETAALQLAHSQSPVVQQARTEAGIDTSIPQAMPMAQAQTVPGERGGIEAPAPQPVAMAATASPERPLVPAVETSYSSDPFLRDTFNSSKVSAMTEPALRQACRRDGVPVERLQELEDAGKLIRLQGKDGVEKITTPEIFEMENRLVASAVAMNARTFYGVSGRVADQVSTHYTLSDDQREVFNHITNGNHSCAVVRGLAGTGKSHTLKAVNEACERSGITMVGCAPTGVVAEDLGKSANIKAFTNHGLLGQIESGKLPLTDSTMIVMDEAGMTNSAIMARIVDHCNKNGSKLVLVGDADQLQPVDLGAPMRSIQNRIGYAELTEIRRQKNEQDREIVKNLANGETAAAVQMMHERGQIVEHKHSDDVMTGVADAYIADVRAGKQTLALAMRNEQVSQLNSILRDRLQQEGLVSSDESKFRVQGKNGPEDMMFAKGDRIMTRENDHEIDVRNGSMGTVERAEDGKIWVRMDSDKESVKQINEKEYNAIERAYAITVHKSQGKTVDNVHYVFDKSCCNSNLGYVAASRHKEEFKLHCTTEDAAKVETAFAREKAKDTAADYTRIPRPEPQTQNQAPQPAGMQAPEVDPRLTAAATAQTQAPQQDPGSRVPAQDYTPEAVAAQQMPTPETQETAPVRFAAQENEQFMGAEKARAMAVQAMHANELAAARNQVLQDRQEQTPIDQQMPSQEPARETVAPAPQEQQMPEKATDDRGQSDQAPAQPAQEAAPHTQEPTQAPQAPEVTQDSPAQATTQENAPQAVEFEELPLDEPVQQPAAQEKEVETSAPEQTPAQRPSAQDFPELPENNLSKVDTGRPQPEPQQQQQAPEKEQEKSDMSSTAANMVVPGAGMVMPGGGKEEPAQTPEPQAQDQPQLPENQLGKVGQQTPAPQAQAQTQEQQGRPQLPENALAKVDTGGPKLAQEAPERGQGDNGRPELPPNALGQASAQGGPQQAPPEQQQQGYGYV